jgi:hypothetical protein
MQVWQLAFLIVCRQSQPKYLVNVFIARKSTMPKNGLKTESAPTQVINMTIYPELFTKPMHVKQLPSAAGFNISQCDILSRN